MLHQHYININVVNIVLVFESINLDENQVKPSNSYESIPRPYL